jgi:hypothetical protein
MWRMRWSVVFEGRWIRERVFHNVVMESFGRRKCIESDFVVELVAFVVVSKKEMDCMHYVIVIVVVVIVMILDVM